MMPLNNLSKNTQVISKVKTTDEETYKKKISTLLSKISKINTDLRVKDELIMTLTSNQEYDEKTLIENAIIDKLKAFERNIKSYCKNNNTTEAELLKLSRINQPKNLREKTDYLKILSEMRAGK